MLLAVTSVLVALGILLGCDGATVESWNAEPSAILGSYIHGQKVAMWSLKRGPGHLLIHLRLCLRQMLTLLPVCVSYLHCGS